MKFIVGTLVMMTFIGSVAHAKDGDLVKICGPIYSPVFEINGQAVKTIAISATHLYSLQLTTNIDLNRSEKQLRQYHTGVLPSLEESETFKNAKIYCASGIERETSTV